MSTDTVLITGANGFIGADAVAKASVFVRGQARQAAATTTTTTSSE